MKESIIQPSIQRQLNLAIYTQRGFIWHSPKGDMPVVIGATHSDPPKVIGWVPNTNILSIEYSSVDALKDAFKNGTVEFEKASEVQDETTE